MTPLHLTILAALEREMAERGMAPTYRELQAASGVKSLSRVQYALTALERDGYIRRVRGRTRAIEVIKSMTNCCPCCGRPMGKATT